VTAAPDVLVVGAGPTGLTLALQAHDHGARVRIVERRPEAFRRSRAFLVHPRTLEVLRPLGVTDELMARSPAAASACLHLGGRSVVVGTGRLSLPDTCFPPLTLLRQTDVERVLGQALAGRGVRVERGTELVDLAGDGAGTRVVLRSEAGVEQGIAATVVGCDGVDSIVRRRAGIGWPGGVYRREVVLAASTWRPTWPPGPPTSPRAAAAWCSPSRSVRAPDGGWRPAAPFVVGRRRRAGTVRRCPRRSCRTWWTGPGSACGSPGRPGRPGCGSSTASRPASGAARSSSPETPRTHPRRPVGRA
jgi:2-polyprenyl-6-methoxyphenol hydroxylase-like FAD-dependent oxidoreductase